MKPHMMIALLALAVTAHAGEVPPVRRSAVPEVASAQSGGEVGFAPRKVGENVLAIPGFTSDISAKHFPKVAELYPTAEMLVGHANYQGIGFNFAVDTSGLTAIGSRIYLHSPGMIICIGQK